MGNDKFLALAKFLEIREEDIETEISAMDYDDTFSVGSKEYRVLTDEEANTAFHESIESYIDDCILCQLPENLRYYFDNEAFEHDVLLSDGRGPSLSSYDGAEEEEKINGIYYFIYRVN